MDYSKGSIRRYRGRWRGQIRYKDGGTWRTATRMLRDDRGPIACDMAEDADPSKAGAGVGSARAWRALARWRDELIATDANPGPAGTGETVRECVDAMVDALEAARAVDGSTVAGYRSTAKLLDLDGDGTAPVGGVPLASLTAQQVRAWVAGLMAHGLSTTTAGKAYRLLRQACRRAVEAGDLEADPTSGVRPPKRKQPDPNALDAEACARLTADLGGMEPSPMACGAALALYAGMRCGECCGLRWADVDLEAATLRVSRAVGRKSGGVYEKGTKNESSRRVVPVSPPLAAMLARRRERMRAECEAVGLDPAKALPALHVLGRVDGSLPDPSNISRAWREHAENRGYVGDKGRRATFHDLRHTFATRAISSGADVKSVAGVLGHSNAAMTLNVYASADPEAQRRAVEAAAGSMGHRARARFTKPGKRPRGA